MLADRINDLARKLGDPPRRPARAAPRQRPAGWDTPEARVAQLLAEGLAPGPDDKRDRQPRSSGALAMISCMAPVYSRLLAIQRSFTGTATLDVAADVVVVIRDVDVYISADLTGAINYRLLGSAGQTIDWAVCDIDTTIVHQWRGRQVMPPGSSWSFVTDGPCDVTISGYVLSP
jgi:hypothetical protein